MGTKTRVWFFLLPALYLSGGSALAARASEPIRVAQAKTAGLSISPERIRIRNDGTNGMFVVHNRTSKAMRLVRFRTPSDLTVRVDNYRAGRSVSFLNRAPASASQFARLDRDGYRLDPGGMMFVSVFGRSSSRLGWRAIGLVSRLEPRGPTTDRRIAVHVRDSRPRARSAPSPRCRAVASALPLACLSHLIYGDEPSPTMCRRYVARPQRAWEPLYRSALKRRGLSDRKIRRAIRLARRAGFNAGIYTTAGRTALVFEGTQITQIGDLITDLGNILGIQTRQYKVARAIAAEAKRLYPNIVLTGHSLGGGLADWAATGSLLNAEIFNPAFPRGIVRPSERALRWGRTHVRAFVIDGELASVAHPGRSSGSTLTFPEAGCSDSKHSMTCVLNTLDRFHRGCPRS